MYHDEVITVAYVSYTWIVPIFDILIPPLSTLNVLSIDEQTSIQTNTNTTTNHTINTTTFDDISINYNYRLE